jgi:hypothetical protein
MDCAVTRAIQVKWAQQDHKVLLEYGALMAQAISLGPPDQLVFRGMMVQLARCPVLLVQRVIRVIGERLVEMVQPPQLERLDPPVRMEHPERMEHPVQTVRRVTRETLLNHLATVLSSRTTMVATTGLSLKQMPISPVHLSV